MEDFEDGDISDWQQYRADEEMIQWAADAFGNDMPPLRDHSTSS